jgi:IS30 family transposase
VDIGAHAQRLEELRARRERIAADEASLTAEWREAIPAARDAGMTVTEIARRTGMSRESIHRIYLK